MTREELLKTAKPILLNTEMVRSILDERKTVTRRVMKPQPKFKLCYIFAGCNHGMWSYPPDTVHEYWGEEYKLPDCITDEDKEMVWNPPYHTDDIMYVRETWDSMAGSIFGDLSADTVYFYKADGDFRPVAWRGNWHPSIHMPKEAARIFLRVTDVRVERLRDITEEQAQKEGVLYEDAAEAGFERWKPTFNDPDSGGEPYYVGAFEHLWNSTIKKPDLARYGWDASPWVWVIEFERIETDENTD